MEIESLQTEQNNIWGRSFARYFQRNLYLPLETEIEDNFAIENPYISYAPSTDRTTDLQRIHELRALKDLQSSQQVLIWNASVDFLISKIEDIIVSYEQLPVSYNQVMLRGALRYCAKLVDKIHNHIDNLHLIEEVRRFVILGENLLKQYLDPIDSITFAHLDLTYIENIFESIEEEASKKGYLPKLEDMPL